MGKRQWDVCQRVFQKFAHINLFNSTLVKGVVKQIPCILHLHRFFVLQGYFAFGSCRADVLRFPFLNWPFQYLWIIYASRVNCSYHFFPVAVVFDILW